MKIWSARFSLLLHEWILWRLRLIDTGPEPLTHENYFLTFSSFRYFYHSLRLLLYMYTQTWMEAIKKTERNVSMVRASVNFCLSFWRKSSGVMCNGVRTAMLNEEWEIKCDAGNFHSSFLECGSFLMLICGWNVKVRVSSILEFISMSHMRSSALSAILRTSFFCPTAYCIKRHNVKVKVFERWQWPKKSIKVESKNPFPSEKKPKFSWESEQTFETQ